MSLHHGTGGGGNVVVPMLAAAVLGLMSPPPPGLTLSRPEPLSPVSTLGNSDITSDAAKNIYLANFYCLYLTFY